MNDNAWERLTDAIDIKLGIARHGRDSRSLEDRPDLRESVQFIEFSRQGTPYRLERTTGPAIVDRKTHYSSRPGTANRIETIYDTNETGHKVTLFHQVDDDWQEIALDDLAL